MVRSKKASLIFSSEGLFVLMLPDLREDSSGYTFYFEERKNKKIIENSRFFSVAFRNRGRCALITIFQQKFFLWKIFISFGETLN